jgi:hypothetical protein
VTIHAQAEGAPFIVEELVKAYREAGMIRAVDGVWTLARNTGGLQGCPPAPVDVS